MNMHNTIWADTQPGSLTILVGAVTPFPAQPAGFPGLKSVTVNSARSAHGKSIQTVRIDQCRKIQAGLSLNPGLGQIIIRDIIAAL